MKNNVRPHLRPTLIVLLLMAFFSNSTKAQTATIDCANVATGPYVPGSSISIPFTPAGSFDSTNKFEVYLSDKFGNFASEVKIGSFTGVYTSHIEALIPGGTAAGTGYKIRIKTTVPASVSAPCAATLDITTGTVVSAGATASPGSTLQAGEYFGWCGGNVPGRQITLTNTSTAGATVTGTLINNKTGASTLVTLTGSTWDITLPDLADYTFIVRAEKNGVVSTKSYTIINNSFNLNLVNYSEASGCIPFVTTLGIITDAGGIANNYKGMRYKVDWGDGTIIFYTYSQLQALIGSIQHTYQQTSCGTGSNSFKVQITLAYPFTSGSCTQPNIGTDVMVFRKPEADFTFPQPACVSTAVTISNASVIGNGNMANVCDATALFTWYVNGVMKYQSSVPEGSPPNLVYTFPVAGKYEIRLDIENNPCGVATHKDSICVEDKPDVSFTIDHNKGCIPFVVKTDTVTNNAKYYCQLRPQDWSVRNADNSAAAASSYTVTGSLTGPEPTITFLKAGKYRIRHRIANSCGTFTAYQDVEVLENKVILPPDKKYCDVQTIDFATSADHKPVYSTSAGTETYQWTVTGGAYEFVNPSTATSAFPVIKFKDHAVYTVTIAFTNVCGMNDTSQLVTIVEPITASIIKPTVDTAVCYDAGSIVLKGATSGGSVASVAWSHDPAANGNFVNGSTPNATYTFGAAEILNGTVKLIFTANHSDNVCLPAKAERLVTIFPENTGVAARRNVCSGDNSWSYQPVSSVAGSLFTWTAAVTFGTVTGYTSQLTETASPISNVLVNTTTDTAVVVYTITPHANGCAGVPYTFKVIVNPIPALTVTQPHTVICSGEKPDLKLESTVLNTLYDWTSVVTAGTINGNTSQATTDPSNIVIIEDVLTNNTTAVGTVEYTIIAKGPTGCPSAPQVKTIDVRPRVTPADAGDDQKLCKETQATLDGNIPQVGTGAWSQTGGPLVNITDPTLYNTTVTGLQPDQEYTFTWTITGTGCSSSSDEMTIYNRPEPSTPDAGIDQVYCNFLFSSVNYVVLTATPVTRSYETGTWTVTGSPAGSTFNFTGPHTAGTSFYFSMPGTYTLAWTISGDATCPTKSDEMTVEVYETPVSGAVAVGMPNVCAGTDVNFTLASYTGTIQKWQYNLDPVNGTTWHDTLVTTPGITFLNVQDTFEVRAVIVSAGYNSSCGATTTTTPVRVYVSAQSLGGHTGTSTAVCKNSNVGGITLTGYLGAITGWETSIDNGANWINIGRANATLVTYSNLSQTTWYRALVKNGDCNEVPSDITIITVKEQVSNADAGGDKDLCNVSTTTLTANTPAAGETGTWTQIDGPNTAIMSSTTDPALTISGLSSGLYRFTWSVENGACPVKTSTVAISISASASGGSTLGGKTFCKGTDDDFVTLSGYFGIINKWQSSIDGGTTWTDINTTQPSLRYTGLPQTTMFRAMITNGYCTVPVFSLPATIVIKDPITNADAGNNQDLCNSSATTLQANAAGTGETGTWSQISGPNTAGISNVNNPQLQLTGLVQGAYKFKWKIDNGGSCPFTEDDVDVTVFPPLTNEIDNTPVTICEGQLVTINNVNVSGGKGAGTYAFQWQYSTDNQATWQDFGLNATYADFSFIATDTMYVRRKVSSGPCTEYSNPTLVTVQAGIANNILTGDQQLCINTAATPVNGTLPTGGDGNYIYVWEQSTDGGNTWAVIPGVVGLTYDPGVLTQTTLYRRKISTALCNGLQTSTSNIVTKTVNLDAKAVFSALVLGDCAPFVIDRGNIVVTTYNDRNDTYTWKANEQVIGSVADFPGYTIVNADDSVTIKLVVNSLYGCKSDSMEVKFYASAQALPSFTVSNDNSCGPLTVTFTNTSPVNNRITYSWDFGNGQTSPSFDPPQILYDIHPDRKDTTYIAKLKAVTPCITKVFEVPITVRARPKAAFTPSKTTGCSPFTVLFNNNSLGERLTYTWNFDDGSKDSVTTAMGQMEHTFVTYVQDTFRVRLIAVNECGSDTLVYNLVVSPNTVRLSMVINGNERIGCAPLTVKFNNNTRGGNAFHWDFGDGNQLNTTENIETIPHEFTQPGKYKITLVGSNGCSDTTGYENVEVLATPHVDFTPLPAEVCIGDSIYFRNDSEPITGIAWNFGDGNTSTLNNPKHAYTAANTYSVTMEGSRQYSAGNVCKATVTKTVKVIPSLPGDFTASDTIGNCVPFTITFTNITKPSALTKWDFGDGENGTGDVISHTFKSNGNFIVSMQAVHPQGCTYVASKPITIQAPEGQWVYDYGYICKDKPVRFEAYAIRTTGYKWVFGDGDTLVSAANVVYHVYKQSGIYIPSVQLMREDCGVWLRGQEQIKVDYYKAGFSFAQQKSCGNSTIAFKDTSRTAFGISRWEWDFGDGATASGATPQHSYSGTNTWPVQLIIYNVSGCSDTTIVSVFAKPNNPPSAAIISNPTGCVRQPVYYTAVVNSEDPVTLYAWTFNNGYSANGEQVINNYGSSGIFEAKLIVGTQYGCYDTTTLPITIYPTPIVNAGNDVAICRGQSAQLGAAGLPSLVWTPTEWLSCTTCPNPVASPADTRQYLVSGINSFGCVGSDSVIVNVIPPSKVEVALGDTICLGQSVQLSAWGNSRYLWSPANTLSASNIADPVATPKLSTTYRVIGTDDKNCFRDTAFVTITVGAWPKVTLGPDKVLSTGTQLQLVTTVLNGPIKKWAWTPVKDLTCPDCSLPVATVKKDVCYTVTVQNNFNCEASDTLCIKAFCESTQVFIPNAFVPGATSNNILMVRGKGIKLVKSFRIFNRWGQMVFDRANFQANEKDFGWDGKINGVPATPDVYVYTCEVLCEDDKAFTYKGNVAILK
jgi:PKD repeat protein